MIGAVIGDTVGSVYEFNNIKTTEFPLFDSESNFTDDSVMTFAVADWLLRDNNHNPQKLIDTFVWFANQFPCPMGGYGGSFHNWLLNPKTIYEDVMMEDGSTKTFMRDVREPYNSWGNGSAMRTSAVGWMFDTLEETEHVAEIQAAITHNHPEGIKGAQATSAAIFMARTGKSKEEIKRYIETRFGYDLSRSCDDIRPGYTFDVSCQGTVPQAITAFLESTDFESCIRLGVSLGGDSDTLTCIAGGIAEAFYKDIPKWIVDEVWRRLPYEFEKILVGLNRNSFYREVSYIPQLSKIDETNMSPNIKRACRPTFIGKIMDKMLGSSAKQIIQSNEIERFIQAQDDRICGYDAAFSEIQDGHKESYWIWYVFPQLRGLGHSAFTNYYGIGGIKEAEEYMSHKVLGKRLRDISNALMRHKDKAITAIVSPDDARRIRSCMTLFDVVCPNDIFGDVLDTFYGSERDRFTEMMLGL